MAKRRAEELRRAHSAATSGASRKPADDEPDRSPATAGPQATATRAPAASGVGAPAAADEVCPICGGIGYVTFDVPLDDPRFSEAVPCRCMADELARRELESVRSFAQMAALAEMTFETFQVEAPGNSPDQVLSLRAAFEAAREFAANPSGWLLLRGGYGCGKSHLAAAIVNERLRRGLPALFVVLPDLLDELRATFADDSADSYEDRFEAVREVPLLVLDDLGAQAPTPWAAEKLYQLLNHRYNNRLPTVVTTNCRLEDLDDRIRSRLCHVGLVRAVEIRALDFRAGTADQGTELSTLHLYRGLTFESWDSRATVLRRELAENAQRAFELARQFAAAPSGWLVFMGQHGCGKTHLAAAIANQRVAVGAPALFVVVPDLLDHLRATYSPTSRVQYDRRFDEVRSTPLLVLDDLGVESATPWAKEKLFQILNYRYAARLATVITMALRLEEVPARLRSRMLDTRLCTIFEIIAPAYYESYADRPPPARRGRPR